MELWLTENKELKSLACQAMAFQKSRTLDHPSPWFKSLVFSLSASKIHVLAIYLLEDKRVQNIAKVNSVIFVSSIGSFLQIAHFNLTLDSW